MCILFLRSGTVHAKQLKLQSRVGGQGQPLCNVYNVNQEIYSLTCTFLACQKRDSRAPWLIDGKSARVL